MNRCVKILLTLFSLAYLGRASGQSLAAIVVPSSAQCPEETAGRTCFTLDEYATDFNHSSVENVSLDLQPGIHVLNSSLSLSDLLSFTMVGDGDATVECMERFSLENIMHVTFSGINFLNCDGDKLAVRDIANFVLEESYVLFEGSESDRGISISRSTAMIVNSTFSGSLNRVLNLFETIALIKECQILNNGLPDTEPPVGGGIIRVSRTSLTIEQSTFSGNFANGRNNAVIYMTNRSPLLSITNSTFFNNTGQESGAILVKGHFESTTITIVGSNFTQNQALGKGFVNIFNRAAVLSVDHLGQSLSLSLIQSVFSNNTGIEASTVSVDGSGNVTLNINSDTLFWNNTAGNLGDLIEVRSFGSAFINITQGVFANNSVNGHGLIDLRSSDSSVVIQQSFFFNNSLTSKAFTSVLSTTSQAEITIINSTIQNNLAKGGCGVLNLDDFRSNSQDVTMIGSVFHSNRANSNGVMCVTHGTVSIVNSTFRHNVAGGSGGVMVVKGNNSVNIQDSVFESNTAAGGSGGVMEIGGNTVNSVNIQNSTFRHNVAAGSGGVIEVKGNYSVNVQGSVFFNNTAGDRFKFNGGGVISVGRVSLPTRITTHDYVFNNSAFINNKGGDFGGVMEIDHAAVVSSQFENCVFSFNQAVKRGGVIAVKDSQVELNFDNETIVSQNTAELGEVISACNSTVTVSGLDEIVTVIPDKTSEMCTLYNLSKGDFRMASFSIIVFSTVLNFVVLCLILL